MPNDIRNDKTDGMCFKLTPGVHSTSLSLASKSNLCSSTLYSQKREAQESSTTVLKPSLSFSRFKVISMIFMAKIILLNLI